MSADKTLKCAVCGREEPTACLGRNGSYYAGDCGQTHLTSKIDLWTRRIERVCQGENHLQLQHGN